MSPVGPLVILPAALSIGGTCMGVSGTLPMRLSSGGYLTTAQVKRMDPTAFPRPISIGPKSKPAGVNRRAVNST